jgi:hypothetical protein
MDTPAHDTDAFLQHTGQNQYFAATFRHLRTLLWCINGSRALDGQVHANAVSQLVIGL